MKPSLLLAGIGVAATLLIGYNAIHRPQQQQLGAVRAQVAAERVREETAAAAASVLQEIERYRKQLPEEPDPSWLVQEAVKLAEQSGVQLTTISQEPPQRFETFTRLGVRFQLTASYHQLGAFLDRLERSNRFIHVDSLNISQARNITDQIPTISLTVSTLYLPSGLNVVGGAGNRN